jgi:integrase
MQPALNRVVAKPRGVEGRGRQRLGARSLAVGYDGEGRALRARRKADVALAARTIRVALSGPRDTTKGGHADIIPIAAELLPFLRAAMDASASDLVFPGPDGKSMMRSDVKLAEMLRRAMARAGLVTGFEHRCRKRGCKHRERHPDQEPRRCPEHHVLLWPVAQVRPIRWHDLRHSTASNLMPAGVSVPVIQRLMRHRDPRITVDVYGHLAPDYVLREIDKLQLGIAPTRARSRRICFTACFSPRRRSRAQRT